MVFAAVIGISPAPTLVSAVELELPVGEAHFPISIRSGNATSFQQGAYEVYVLKNGCEIRQGDVHARGSDAVLWIDRAEAYSGKPSRVIAYFEGDVHVRFGRLGDPTAVSKRQANTLVDRRWLGRFTTNAGIELSVPLSSTNPDKLPAIVERGRSARQGELARTTAQLEQHPPSAIADNSVVPAQFTTQEIAPPAAVTPGTGGRRVRIFRRNNTPFQYKTFAHPQRDEQVTMFTSGIQVIVEGLDELGTVTMETDRLVIWSPRVDFGNANAASMQLGDGQYEFYLEGNIVFRQGDRVIYADRMFYNVARESGVVLSAELLTPIPDYQGLVRLKADVLQQLDRQHFQAYGAALTSSRLGIPRYWLQTEKMEVEDIQRPLVDPFSNQTAIDPVTGQPAVNHQMLATSRNNYFYLMQFPVLYWPTIATDLTNPTFYLEKITVRQDQIFGSQVMLDWNMYQLLGVRQPPPGTKWSLSTDYFSNRGPALGTTFKFDGNTLMGVPGPYQGFADAWGIYDTGLDTLGADRRNLTRDEEFRGRILAQHRQYLPNDWRLSAEFGIISDRNFLEQFFESEWDTYKDESTGIELKRAIENQSFSLTADVRLNDFVTQTEWLPRLDHFLVGQSLLFDTLTWHEHSQVGYARLQTAVPPTNAVDAAKFDPLPWESQQEGVVASSRQSIELPVQLGVVKLAPYALGEAAFFGNDVNGDSNTRLYGQAGIKGSLPMWSVNHDIQSELLNLRGLAHKLVFDADYSFSDADKDLNQFPLYHPLDDDSTEHFRRRLKFNTFGLPAGTPVPLRFDDRNYAVRSGMQNWVTSNGTEIADDLQLLRLGMRNRWQTKRGLPGQERIIDWITFDLEASFFPDAARDNFGEQLGLVDYDFKWHIGDRFSILADGFVDFFDGGLQQYTVGGMLDRPEVGNFYLGYRRTDGPFNANVILASAGYRMSDKWLFAGGTSFDLNNEGAIGQNFSLTRVGEAFLIRAGFNVDYSRSNVGVQLGIEPRFIGRTRLGVAGGVPIPPAGAFGIE